MKICTQHGVTKSQPGTAVSYCTDDDGQVVLHVYRIYQNITNKYGGKGKIKALDAHGKKFPSWIAAKEYALAHGYVQVHRHDRTLYKYWIGQNRLHKHNQKVKK
jgi:hypothetical protein